MITEEEGRRLAGEYADAIKIWEAAGRRTISARQALEDRGVALKEKEASVAKTVQEMFDGRNVRATVDQRETEVRIVLAADDGWVALKAIHDDARRLLQEHTLESEVARERCQQLRATMYFLASLGGGTKTAPDVVS